MNPKQNVKGPSLREFYRASSDGVSPALVSRRALASLDQVIAAVPGHADTAGLELRLDGDDGRVDLGVGLSLSSEGDCFLADLDGDPGLSRAVQADDRWRRLHEFGLHWRAESEWRVRAPFLFLEYDGDVPLQPVPVPSVFIGLDWPLEELGEEARRRGREDPTQTQGLAHAMQMLAVLRPQPLSAATDSLIAQCFALMPTGGLVLHLAVMLGRPGEAVRLSLSVPCQDAPAYFRSLGWSHGLSALDSALSFEAEASGSTRPQRLVQIDVDVGDTLGPAVGVMLQPSPTGSWHRLLEVLVAAGYCHSERRDSLLAWPSISVSGREGSSFERYLAHAKITCGNAVEPNPKAYIGVRQRQS